MAPGPRRRGREVTPEVRPGRLARDTADAENERLRKENEKLAAELARTKAALEIVGKAHALLELLSGSGLRKEAGEVTAAAFSSLVPVSSKTVR
jgi:hypothetical protein